MTHKRLLRQMFAAAVDAAQPSRTIAAHLPKPPRGRTIVIGAGKGSGAMAAAFEKAWKGKLADDLDGVRGWKPIAVRKVAAHPVAVASRSHMNPATADMLAHIRCSEHRSIGSSLKFCLVAEAEASTTGERQQVEPDGGDVLAELTGLDVGRDLVEELRLDEMHLPQVRLRRIASDTRAVLDRLAHVRVAIDPKSCEKADAK